MKSLHYRWLDQHRRFGRIICKLSQGQKNFIEFLKTI